MRCVTLACLLLFIIQTVTSVSAEDPVEPPPWEDAVVYKSKYHRIRTNTGKKYADQTGELLTALHDAFKELCRGSAVKLRRVSNLPISVFARREEYQEFMRGWKPEKADSPGYQDDEAGIFVYRRSEGGRDETLETILHEGIHQLVQTAANGCRTSNKPGFWIEEGLADYFAGMTLKNGKLEAGLRRDRLYRLKLTLEANRIYPLERFVMFTQEGWNREKYAQGWALTHFFVTANDGRYKKRFLAYVKLIIQSRGSAKTFKKAFGCEPSKFEEKFKEHLMMLKKR